MTFQEGRDELIHKDGTVFPIEVHERLYYLKMVNNKRCVTNAVNDMMSTDKVNLSCDVKTWHEILGHCNINDVLKLPNVVEGMRITGNTKIDCMCALGGNSTRAKIRKLMQKLVHPWSWYIQT